MKNTIFFILCSFIFALSILAIFLVKNFDHINSHRGQNFKTHIGHKIQHNRSIAGLHRHDAHPFKHHGHQFYNHCKFHHDHHSFNHRSHKSHLFSSRKHHHDFYYVNHPHPHFHRGFHHSFSFQFIHPHSTLGVKADHI